MTKATFTHFYQTTRHHISEDGYHQFTVPFSMYDNAATIQLGTHAYFAAQTTLWTEYTKCLHIPSTCPGRKSEEAAGSLLFNTRVCTTTL